MNEMNERESWSELRDRRMQSRAAGKAYEEAWAAYDLGRMVRDMREARGLSQRQLAERMGTTQSVVGRLESGGSRPTLATLERVAEALGLVLEVRFHEARTGSGLRRGVTGRRASGPTRRAERGGSAVRG
jgi:ribosome-binding protein aMBF1 (putative translation factor)